MQQYDVCENYSIVHDLEGRDSQCVPPTIFLFWSNTVIIGKSVTYIVPTYRYYFACSIHNLTDRTTKVPDLRRKM